MQGEAEYKHYWFPCFDDPTFCVGKLITVETGETLRVRLRKNYCCI
jgi:aminopeptidase N